MFVDDVLKEIEELETSSLSDMDRLEMMLNDYPTEDIQIKIIDSF